jgi:hypothetical protein
MRRSKVKSKLKAKLLSIYAGIDETCKKAGSRLQSTAAGEVHFIDPDHGSLKFLTRELSRPSELLDAIRTGWVPCGFIVFQEKEGRTEMHVGNYSWMSSVDEHTLEECNRYIKERLDRIQRHIDAAEKARSS